MRRVLAFSILFAFILSLPAWAADISGTWTISQKNNEGLDDSFDAAIKAAGDKLTITGSHSKIGALSGTGTLKGDDISMTIDAAGADGKGALSFSYTGKVSGNRMSGTKETKISGASPGGGQATAGNNPTGGQGAPSMAQGGAPGASDGVPGATVGAVSKEWTAVKK